MRRRIKETRSRSIKEIIVDGIKFASGLEAYMYKALKKQRSKQIMKKERLRFLKDLILQMNLTKDKQTVRVVWLIEVIKNVLSY